MKHLVIGVSLDSSLKLLAHHADIVILDDDPSPDLEGVYETVYIRSHFSTPELLPQVFRTEIDELTKRTQGKNLHVTFVDSMDTVDAIVAFEDKWAQYNTFSDYMPHTELFNEMLSTAGFIRPIFKHRLASRGTGVTWDIDKVIGPVEEWIVQESLDITEELRVYIIKDQVYPIGAVRHSMTSEQKTQAVDSRKLNQDEIDFASEVGKRASHLDILGLDIARTTDGRLRLIEVNRSPGFAEFERLTGVNLADLLYG